MEFSERLKEFCNRVKTLRSKIKTEEATKDMLEDLAADYAKTFLAAGDAAGKAAFPYESVYTGTDSQFGGSVQMNLNAEYAARGLSMKEYM